MRHQSLILAIIENQIAAIIGESLRGGETRKINRETGVDRVAADMDEPGMRQRQADCAEMKKVERVLIGDTLRTGSDPTQKRQVTGCQSGRGIFRGGRLPLIGPERQFAASATKGCDETICSTSVVPERGIPTMSAGGPSLTGVGAPRTISSGAKVSIIRSIESENAARSKGSLRRSSAFARSK
jgi:hypothetical protein